MIDAYLVVAGVLAMVAGYIAIINYMLSHVERRDLAALGCVQSKQTSPKSETTAPQSPNALPARA